MNAILLAGGQSSRYGRNKALINFRGEMMIKKISTVLQAVFEKVYVVGTPWTDYSFLNGVILLEDIVAEKGPLGGLYTGLTYSDTEYNYLTACDMPFITINYLNFVLNCGGEYDILIPEYRGHLEPLAAVYRQSCLPFITDSITANYLKVKSFFPAVKVRILKEAMVRQAGDPERLFYNINRQSDLKTVRKLLEAH